jgi:hypothetical protein
MSSDKQFTANGPTDVGFQTDGSNIARGAEIGGNQLGVKGACGGANGDGIQGFGGSSGGNGVRGQGGDGTTDGTSPGVVGWGGEGGEKNRFLTMACKATARATSLALLGLPAAMIMVRVPGCLAGGDPNGTAV